MSSFNGRGDNDTNWLPATAGMNSSDGQKGQDNSNELDLLLSETQRLQKDITSLFTQFTDINRDLRTDINEFCDICDTSIANISVPNTSTILNERT